MSIRNIKLVSDEYFHIYNRGNGKHKIFLDEEDYDRFEKILYICNSEKNFNFRDSIVDIKIEAYDLERGTPIVSILAWVLMPNHFHLFLISPRHGLGEDDEENISKYIHKVSTAYAMYFNKKYKRTGRLFESAFKSKYANDDTYLRYLYAYIHLNPAKMIDKNWKSTVQEKRKDIIDFIKQYKYSSFHDYCGIIRNENAILNKKEFPIYFKNAQDFTKNILQWISLDVEEE